MNCFPPGIRRRPYKPSPQVPLICSQYSLMTAYMWLYICMYLYCYRTGSFVPSRDIQHRCCTNLRCTKTNKHCRLYSGGRAVHTGKNRCYHKLCKGIVGDNLRYYYIWSLLLLSLYIAWILVKRILSYTHMYYSHIRCFSHFDN